MSAPRVLMLSFQFPPMAGSSGVQRCLRFARELPALGWEPLILSAGAGAYEQCSDDQLDAISPDWVVARAPALDAARHLSLWRRYPGWLATPDRWVSWLACAIPMGLAMIRRHRPAVLWSTYPIPSAHWLGWWLARLSGLPWVADFRDPMAHQGYPEDPQLWQHYARLEQRIFARARRACFTTPGALRLYAQRFPAAAPRLRLIENGYVEEEFQQAQALMPALPPLPTGAAPRDDTPCLLHSGVLYPRWRNPEALFMALAQLRREQPRLLPRLALRASGHEDWLRALAAQHGVADLVTLLPPLPYAQALAEMLQADALLLLQSDECADQIPAKAYEYLRAGRPVLALASGDTAALMRDAGLSHLAALEDSVAIAAQLRRFVLDWQAGACPRPAPERVAAASRRARAAQLADCLNEARISAPNPTKFPLEST